MKTQLQMNYVILKETDLYKSNSVGNWTENLINLNLNGATNLYVSILN
jgi:hypothetical protein